MTQITPQSKLYDHFVAWCEDTVQAGLRDITGLDFENLIEEIQGLQTRIGEN